MAKVKKAATKNQKSKSSGDSFMDSLIDVMEVTEPLITTLWGKPGTGKTATASTWPKPILILDIIDKGSTSAQSKDLKKGDIKVKLCKDWNDILESLDWLEENPSAFKTVVFDHLTNALELGKDKLLSDNSRTKMTQPMFGELSGMMKDIIMRGRALVDEGINPVFIAEDRTDQPTVEDEETVLDPSIGPALQPAVQTFLVATSKIVGRQYIASYDKKVKIDGKTKSVPTIEFRLGIGPNPYYQTKIRKPRGAYCPDFIVNPTYDDLLAITKGEYTNPEEKATKKKKSKK